VKIDPGCAFQFKLQTGDEISQNRLINTREKLGPPQYWLADQKDIQTSNNDSTTDFMGKSYRFSAKEFSKYFDECAPISEQSQSA